MQNNTLTTASIEVGQTFNDEINGEGDTDVLAITIEAGQTLDFTLDASFFREISLVDSEGNIVAQPDIQFNGNRNLPEPSFQFQAEETGIFFYTILGAEPLSSIATGDYSLTVTEIEDDTGNFTSNATALEGSDNIINGTFEYFTDRDAYTVDLSAGDTLNVQIDEELAAAGISILGPDGLVPENIEVLDFVITRFGRFEFNLEVEALEAGTYTILAENDFGSIADFNSGDPGTGDYTLTVNVDSADSLIGTTGNDELQGTSGNDVINGLRGADQLNGGRGADELNGGNGADVLNGNRGADDLNGGNGADFLSGGNGRDTLEGGNGNDVLVGGNGADTFIITETSTSSHDVIDDFGRGNDRLDVSDFADDFDDLNIVTNNDGNVAIYFSEDQSVTFDNLTDVDALSAEHFIFQRSVSSNYVSITPPSYLFGGVIIRSTDVPLVMLLFVYGYFHSPNILQQRNTRFCAVTDIKPAT